MRALHNCESCGISSAATEVRESHGRWLCRKCYLDVQKMQRTKTDIQASPGPSRPDAVQKTAEDHNRFPLTDLGNAERFATLFGDQVRLDPERGLWLICNGRFWQWDEDTLLLAMGRCERKMTESTPMTREWPRRVAGPFCEKL